MRLAALSVEKSRRVHQLYLAIQGILSRANPATAEVLSAGGFDVGLAIQTAQDALEGRPEGMRRLLAGAGAVFLVSQVDALTKRFISKTGTDCESDVRTVSIFDPLAAACSAQVLIQGAYRPIAEYVAQGGDMSDAPALSSSIYRGVLQQPALAFTPLILNVGLGAQYIDAPITGASGESFIGLTLLDKIGVAFVKHNGESSQFEWGMFVGGFLDALIRTAADTEQKYWLLGTTLGWPRIGDTDLGFEVHGALAIPFTFNEDPRLTLGAAIVVPFSAVLDDDER